MRRRMRSIGLMWLLGASIAVAAVLALGAGRSIAVGPACAQLGIYTTGGSTPASPFVGALTLQSYTGCGHATAGRFAFSNAIRLPVLPAPAPPAGAHGASFPILGLTGVLTMTGTLVQDPSHAADATFVLVDAAVSYGEVVQACSGTCPAHPHGPQCPAASCLLQGAVRTLRFTKVTGYLQVQSRAVRLVFLPMPDPVAALDGISALTPITILATHSGS